MPSPRQSRNGPFGWKLKDCVVPGQNGFDGIQSFPRRLWLLCIYSMTFGHDLLGCVVEPTQDRRPHRLVSRESFAAEPFFLDFESPIRLSAGRTGRQRPRTSKRMTTALISHAACLDHDTPPGHPECADRLRAVLRALETREFEGLKRLEAPLADEQSLLRGHTRSEIDQILLVQPAEPVRKGDP